MKHIEFRDYTKYDEGEVLAIYESVEWSNYTNNPDMLKKAYENSLYIKAAYHNDNLVGIIRVIGDGHSIIYIQDIIVNPDYQRDGIGSRLLKDVLAKYDHVYQKMLLTENEEKTVKFYESVGFKADHELGCVAFCQFGL